MSSLKLHFNILAGYNAWANERLYSCVGQIGSDAYRNDCGAFFGSIEGTLNHLLVTDRIWRHRLSALPETGYCLDQILFDNDLPGLRLARKEEDKKIVDFIVGLSEADLSTTITYRRASTPELKKQIIWSALAHWFNHQAHHRGQVHAMLSRVSGKAPELDLLIYQRQQENSN
ncbi:DinB family protein [Yersinia rochesterensis]|uniref:DinB family protein n=1 Tax=Yersinia rochesterensis TaxID=1604335 RepID=UPI0011A8ED0F|nr:DinB family protein [Yersinia rochesterensis]